MRESVLLIQPMLLVPSLESGMTTVLVSPA
jgi:hypothetical protein